MFKDQLERQSLQLDRQSLAVISLAVNSEKAFDKAISLSVISLAFDKAIALAFDITRRALQRWKELMPPYSVTQENANMSIAALLLEVAIITLASDTSVQQSAMVADVLHLAFNTVQE